MSVGTKLFHAITVTRDASAVGSIIAAYPKLRTSEWVFEGKKFGSPLHVAALSSSEEVVRTIISAGSDLLLEDGANRLPIVRVARFYTSALAFKPHDCVPSALAPDPTRRTITGPIFWGADTLA